MRHYSITQYRWNGFREVQTGRFGVIACSTGHALEEAIRLYGPAHYTALELPATPDPIDVWDGSYYHWHITKVGKQDLRSPYHVAA